MRFFGTVGFLFTLILGGSWAPAAPLCSRVYAGRQKTEINQTVTHWYTPIEMGYHDKWIRRDPTTGRRWLLFFQPADGRHRLAHLENVEIMPGARDDSGSYYAQVSINQSNQGLSANLYPLQDTYRLTRLVDQTFELTWNTYLQEGTVTREEVEDFKRTEAELAPQRKVNFVTTTQDGRTLAVMRVYDGSPYPVSFFGDAPAYFVKTDTDPRLPIERRYPELNVRSESSYVFEAGRLAKTEDVDNILEFQFYNLGAYLLQKFGYLGVAPPEYVHKGRVYIEITAKHLRYYMTAFNKGGMGFHLHAMSREGGPMQEVQGDPGYASLKVNRNDTSSKFVLYLDVLNFISQFYRTMETKPAQEVYPERFR